MVRSRSGEPAVMRAPQPPSRAAPRCAGRKLDAVAGRVAHVERATAAWPELLVLDRDAVRDHAFLPAVEGRFRHREAGMARAAGAVRRYVAVAPGGLGVEHEEHRRAGAEEAEQAGLAAVERQSQDVAVEALRRIEVRGVEHSLEHAGDRCHLSRSRGRAMPVSARPGAAYHHPH